MNNKNSMKFESLQYVRAISILLVFVYHTYLVSSKYIDNIDILSYFKYSGMIGVLFFFIISGFIMTHVLLNQEKHFYLKRFLRIYPIFIMAVMIVIFLKVLFFTSIKEHYLPYAITLLPLEIMLKTPTLVPSYPLGIEWSLIFEIFFYIIVGFFNNNFLRRFFLIFVFCWLIVILYYYINEHTILSTRVTFNTILFSLYNIPFIFGVMLYYFYNFTKNKFKNKFRIPYSYYIYAVLSVVLSNYIIDLTNNHMLRIVSISFIGIIFIFVLLSNEFLMDQSLIGKSLIKIGDASYGIYLLHLSILSIAFSIMSHKMHVPINMSYIVIVMIITIVTSYLYGCFDIYLYKKLKNKVKEFLNE